MRPSREISPAAATVLGVAAVITGLVGWFAWSSEATLARMRFNRDAAAIEDRIATRWREYVAVLRGGAGLFSVHPDATPAEFRTFVNALLLRQLYPGTLGVGFTRRVPPRELEAFVARERRIGSPDFRIWPEGPREELHSIVRLEPLDERNRAAIGYDMYSEATRRDAMARARDSGESAMSGRVTLVQETGADVQPGVLIYVPVYEPGPPPTSVAERRERLIGFSYMPLRTGDLFGALFEELDSPLAFEVFDGEAADGAQRLYAHGAPSRAAEQHLAPMTLGGRAWLLRFARPPPERAVVLSVVGAGLLLGLIAASAVRSREEARRREREQHALLAASEERFRGVFESNAVGIAVVTRAGGFVEVNQALLEMLGFERNELLRGQRSWRDLTPPDYAALEARAAAELAERGRAAPVEEALLRKDGGRTPVMVHLADIPDSGLRVAVVVDLRSLRSAQLELHRATQKLRFHIDNSPLAVLELDREFRVTSWSPGAERVFGWRAAEVVGRSIAELRWVHEEDEAPVRARMREMQEGRGSSNVLQNRNYRKDGSVISCEWYNSALVGADGALESVFSLVLDVTERERAAAEREQHLASLEQALAFSDMFVGILGHDLRNPLSSIVLSAQLLLQQIEDDGHRDRLTRLLNSAQRMAQMIDQILDLTRARLGGGIPVHPAPTDLAEICRTVVAEHGDRQAHPIVIETDGDTRGSWDPGRLAQALSNLVGNALEHGRPDTPVLVRVDGSAADRVLVQVHNEGAIPGELLPAIFEPFRGQRAGARRGLGLGLYITQQIARAHGSDVRVISDDPLGTTFTLDLKRARPSSHRAS